MPASVAAGKWLLDTGPLVALLSRNDAAHEQCVETFASLPGPLLSTEEVLTEAMHLVGKRPRDAATCLDFFIRAGALLLPMTAQRLARCRELMARYSNVPMDFADATLVALAEELEIGNVLTLDHRGFVTYRWNRTRRFTILP